MNILYYIPTLSKKDGGIYQYSLALLNNVSANSNHTYFVCHLYESKEISDLANKYPNRIILIPPKEISEPLYNLAKRIFRKFANKIFSWLTIPYKAKEKSFIDHMIRKYKIDIVHSPVQFLPQHLKIPSIVTIHDVQHFHLPRYFSSQELKSRKIQYQNAINGASAVVVSYQHIKNDIHRFFNKSNEQIHVCLLDMEHLWIEKYLAKKATMPHLNLSSDFILYPAATWEHKNHLKLIEAIYHLKKKKNIIINLVFTGHKTAFYSVIEKKIMELGLIDQIKFLGIVTDDELYALYHTCKGVVVPTLYEAGSFPLMESIIMSVPVICSDVTSLPETIGNPKFTFNPNDEVDIAEKIYMLLFNDSFRKENIDNLTKRAIKLKYNNFLGLINNVYTSVLKLKVLHINTNDLYGGAAQEAYELVHKINTECRLLVQMKESKSNNVLQFRKNLLDTFIIILDKLIWKIGIKKGIKNILSITNQFNFTYAKLNKLEEYREANIIHLHNIHGNYFDLSALPKIASEKRIVWTLHDMWAITGGEAHTFENENYKKGIGITPYGNIYPLNDSMVDRRQHFIEFKKHIYSKCRERMTFVPVSNWLEKCLLSSYVYNKNIKVKLIHNGVDTDIFQNNNQRNWEKPRILFFNINNPFKGNELFTGILEDIKEEFDLYVVGEPLKSDIAYHQLPYTNDREELNRLFNQVNFLIFPSLAESFGLTVLEAMASGVCVIASNVGGIPDMLDSSRGYLFKSGDGKDLLEKINTALLNFNESKLKALSAAQYAKNFSLEGNSNRYLHLYLQILGLEPFENDGHHNNPIQSKSQPLDLMAS